MARRSRRNRYDSPACVTPKLRGLLVSYRTDLKEHQDGAMNCRKKVFSSEGKHREIWQLFLRQHEKQIASIQEDIKLLELALTKRS